MRVPARIRCRVEIIPDKRKVVGLVEQAYEGKICLPNFQRDFVWTREEVADLVRSIVRGYFIGSLLLLRCEPNNPPFAPVFLRATRVAWSRRTGGPVRAAHPAVHRARVAAGVLPVARRLRGLAAPNRLGPA